MKPKKVRVDEDLMPTNAVEEPGQESLRTLMASILNDEEYRRAFKARAQSGDLTPAEGRLLVELGLSEANAQRPVTNTERAFEFMAPSEIRIVAEGARIMRRALARASGTPLRDDPVRRVETRNLLGEEIIEWRSY